MSKVARVGRCAVHPARFWNASGPWRSDGRNGGRALEIRRGGARLSNREGRARSVRSGGPRALRGSVRGRPRRSPTVRAATLRSNRLRLYFAGSSAREVLSPSAMAWPCADRKRTGSVMNSERICVARCARKKLPSPRAGTGSTRPRGSRTMRCRPRPPFRSRGRRSGRERESANGGLFVRETEPSAGPPGENDLPPAAPNSRATGDRALAERTAVPPCPIPVPGRPATEGAAP